MTEPIRVWPYYKAPEELQFSTNGGDEDWLALVPSEYSEWCIGWLDIGRFACCGVDEFNIRDDGSVVERYDHDSTWREVDGQHTGRAEEYSGCQVYIGCHG